MNEKPLRAQAPIEKENESVASTTLTRNAANEILTSKAQFRKDR